MKKFLSLLLSITLFTAAIPSFSILTATAATVEDLTYEISGETVTVTDCDTSASGKMEIPDTIEGYPVTAIGDRAFSACTALTDITVPSTVTDIAEYAFSGCTGLTNVIIPISVTNIGFCSFKGCSSLQSMTLPITTENMSVHLAYIFGTTSTSPTYVTKYVPATLTEVTVAEGSTDICDNAFWYCSGIKNIIIPNSVTSIGRSAFNNCSGLTEIDLPDGLISIGKAAFYGCSGIKNIAIPDSVTSIGANAFQGTGYYNSSANWKGGVLYCGNHLLAAKTSLNGNYKIKDGTLSIADYGFFNCTSLTGIAIPDSVKAIGEFVFYGCTSLKNAVLSKNIATIGEKAFYNCTSLTTVVMFNNITYIGLNSFANCSALADVYYYGTKADWSKIYIEYGNTPLSNAARHYVVFGDLNGDGATNANDLTVLRQALLSQAGNILSDINKDTCIDVRDLIKLKKMLTEI